ncbi:MAG: diacylglycerol kinase family lipid kinase [Chitinophagales bacterium]
MNNKYFVCVNPMSGAGKAGKDWTAIKEKLHAAGLNFEYVLSTAHRETILQTQNAIESGYKKILSVGGDGTLHHVVNGIFLQNKIDYTEIETSIISIGTGNDWVRYYNFPNNYDEAIKIIKQGKHIHQDVGLLSYENGTKKEYFMNFAGIGFDAYVVEHTADLKKYGAGAYYYGLLKSLFQYNNVPLEVYADGNLVAKDKAFIAIIGLGKYIGGGMKLCKNATLDDGFLDLTLGKNLTKFEITTLLPKLFSGNFLDHPKVNAVKCKKVKVLTNGSKTTKAETDGELIGIGDFEIELIPKALKTVIP